MSLKKMAATDTLIRTAETDSQTSKMKTAIMYMELKTHEGSHDDRGPAKIGRVTFSKSGRSIHYKGKTFQRTKGPIGDGNFVDVDTGEVYWISGPKKNGGDRYPWGERAPVEIDEDVREEYWCEIRNLPERKDETTA